MLDHVTRESWIIKEKQGFYYKQGVVVHFTLALFETDTLDITASTRKEDTIHVFALWWDPEVS